VIDYFHTLFSRFSQRSGDLTIVYRHEWHDLRFRRHPNSPAADLTSSLGTDQGSFVVRPCHGGQRHSFPVVRAGANTSNPVVDGIQFEAHARDERRTVRVCSTTRNCLDDEPVAVATRDGFAISATLKSYPVGWWDTGGYGICFTRTAGSRGQDPIDPGCLDPDRAPLAAVNRPNPLTIGRGYGAGGRSCWNKHQAARFGDHCDNLLDQEPLTDAAAPLAELAHDAAGAVYLYWLEK
jgi:hypothetical protein